MIQIMSTQIAVQLSLTSSQSTFVHSWSRPQHTHFESAHLSPSSAAYAPYSTHASEILVEQALAGIRDHSKSALERVEEVFVKQSAEDSDLLAGPEPWEEVNLGGGDIDDAEGGGQDIPEYVLQYAPLVHLFSKERYWPSDIAEHLQHVTPTFNYTPIQRVTQRPTLTNLDRYNAFEHARWVFLTSKDDPETYPEWLGSQKNIPQPVDDGPTAALTHGASRAYFDGLKLAFTKFKQLTGSRRKSTADHDTAVRGGRSSAPAILITVRKPNGIVDAFWFYFYSFNQGNSVFNVRFGNHVGDWEHSCIRFHHGTPRAVYYSEHSFGSAYSYKAVEKYGTRPVVYSAVGTHANYATAGGHPYILPWGILHDQTDRGPLWDPTLNAHTYTYNYTSRTISASTLTPDAPTQWFDFAGHWGDRTYPVGDGRQYKLFGQYHYVTGPLGPKFKNLGRRKVCGGPDTKPCVIKRWLRQEEHLGTAMPNSDQLDTET